jgi:hypothetical protein
MHGEEAMHGSGIILSGSGGANPAVSRWDPELLTHSQSGL